MFKNPKAVLSNQVFTTTDYSLFKSIDGNRNKNLLHINKLKKSMSENYLYTILIVNEKYEIIDGQHRFDVIKQLNLPLNYVICKGYGLSEVHILNQNSKTWNSDDYLAGYVNLGIDDYIKYDEFKKKYKFGHHETMSILSGVNTHSHIENFYGGRFTIADYNKAVDIAEKIYSIEPYYEGITRRSFVQTMISLLKNPNFDYKEFIKKLKVQPTALKDCVNVEAYKELIEEIYNHRRSQKVNLRY